jgi:hypothetical protein
MKLSISKYLTMAVLSVFALPGLAVDKSDLPQHIDTGNSQLELCGAVTLRALGLIKFGYAGLYLDHCDEADALLQGSVAQQYSVLLTRDAEGERLRDMAIDSLQDNFDDSALAARRDVFNCMTSAYANTAEGSRIDVRFEPQQGLRMLVDNQVVADCGGSAEAAGYFSIWFGAQPFNETMRDKLLSQAQASAQGDNQARADDHAQDGTLSTVQMMAATPDSGQTAPHMQSKPQHPE